MRAALIQRQIKLNCDTLTGLYEEYSKLRTERKKFNEAADGFAQRALNSSDDEEVTSLCAGENACREQATVYTPYIVKFKKKIAALEEVQKALKHELKCAQCCEAFSPYSGAETFQQSGLVNINDFSITYNYDHLFLEQE
jgi:uncharacterized coiled-coil DUF342 family protein